MSTLNLTKRIQRLEDLEAIRHLTARYSFHVNKGWNGKVVDLDAMPTIFAEDVKWNSWDSPVVLQGIEQGLKLLKDETDQIDFSMHSLTNPVIELTGDQATGNWLMWTASRRKNVPPNQVFMSMDIKYVRKPQGWLIQALSFHFGMRLLE